MKNQWNTDYIKITKNNDGPKVYWQVAGMLPHRDAKGKRLRIRKRFDSKAKAISYADDQKDRGMRYLASGETRQTRLHPHEENDAIAAIKLIQSKSPKSTLMDAALLFVNHVEKVKERINIDDAIENWITNPAFTSNSDVHQYQFTRRIKFFGKHFDGNLKIDEVTADQIEEFIHDENRDVSDKERLNQYACVHAFFGFAKKKKWVADNTCTEVAKPKPDGVDPVALSIPEVKKLMKLAEQVDAGSMVPYFALATFSAIRPSEILRLDWSKFVWDDDKPCVVIDGKGKRRRSVELHETCIKWVKPYALKQGEVAPANARKLFNFIRALAGYRIAASQLEGVDKEGFDNELKGHDDTQRPEWVRDVMRHTGITYFLKERNDKHYVSSWAGNSPQVIDSNYRAVDGVTASTCKQFWNILPSC